MGCLDVLARRVVRCPSWALLLLLLLGLLPLLVLLLQMPLLLLWRQLRGLLGRDARRLLCGPL
jgi:hypothetical protein